MTRMGDDIALCSRVAVVAVFERPHFFEEISDNKQCLRISLLLDMMHQQVGCEMHSLDTSSLLITASEHNLRYTQQYLLALLAGLPWH